MATAEVEYLGALRTKCVHLQSTTEIITDAPVDNKGKGEAFSPTDLVAAAYASCMITIVGIYCENNNVFFEHGKAAVTKIMSSDPRKIKRIEISFDFSGNGWDDSQQTKIIRAAEACPVAKTLGDNIEVDFIYQF
jgi:putative redox protein